MLDQPTAGGGRRDASPPALLGRCSLVRGAHLGQPGARLADKMPHGPASS
jgi:hypothetical protein